MEETMIQPDADGQLHVKLPAFVDDPEAYLRQDTLRVRQHLDRMDAQAYGMLIWRVLQMEVFSHVEIQAPDDDPYYGTCVKVSFQAHASCPDHVAECVAKGLEDNLNRLQSDAIAVFIGRLKSAGPITRERADELVGGAYDSAFSSHGADTAPWRVARSTQESVRIRENTASIQSDKATWSGARPGWGI